VNFGNYVQILSSQGVQILDHLGDADSKGRIYYSKAISGFLMWAQVDNVYQNKALYLYDSSAYRAALFDHFPDDATLEGDLTLGSPATSWQTFNAIGSANAQYIPCCFMDGEDGEQEAGQYGIIKNLTGNNPFWAFTVPLPTTKGGLSLYVDDVVIGIEAADGNDYITGCAVRGMTGTTQTLINSSGGNKTTAGDATYSFTGKDASSYDVVKVVLQTVTTNANDLKINYVKLRYWYQ
jgi:hypothetical protein